MQMNRVPYRHGPAMNDLLATGFDLMCDRATSTTNQIRKSRDQGVSCDQIQGLVIVICRHSMPPGEGFRASAWHAMGPS